jgi:glucose/arabinose dehydrogenase/PKD repeat protein
VEPIRVRDRRSLSIRDRVRGLFLAAGLLALTAPPADAGTLPAGFVESVVLSGLNEPTVVEFAADGRVFVAEKSGVIKVFNSLADPSVTVFADLRTNVYNFWDRGLLGMALHPNFPSQPYVYVLYTYDAAIGGTAPRWGTAGATSDPCPSPPGPTTDGCVVSGRLSRLVASGNVMVGPEQVLIEDWCQQFPSHSIGTVTFGPDGALYVSAGDGASFNIVDYGQRGSPRNPCGDPPTGVGGTQTAPSAEGGALRSQDLRTSGDPVTLDGSILRLNPDTGEALPNNPLATHPDPNARRIIAHGLRNPFRITARPGTSEIWIGDVGWNDWEEINRIVSPTSQVVNFGWPCYEGPGTQNGYDGANLTICEQLYGQANAVTPPFLTYNHDSEVVPGESCPPGSSSISGLAFYRGGSYPASYTGALFFADYSRNCIWVMFNPPAPGSPPPILATFVAGAAAPVELKVGPNGDLFYVDLSGGTIRRVQYLGSNHAPTAVAQASPLSGPVPLTVTFDGRGSTDPDAGDTLSYAWDLDGDGQFDDSNLAQPTATYNAAGSYVVRLMVTDSQGVWDVSDPIVITVGSGGTGPPGLMAAYGFNEGTGSVVVDASGNGHTGTVSGATWATAGKYGGALAFDGVDWVTIAPSGLLNLTTAMTLSAWVNPAGTTGWQTVMLKEQTGGLVYALYGSGTKNRPAAHVSVAGVEQRTGGLTTLPANTWTHLAATYDGAALRLYVNGAEVSARAMTGPIATSTGPLRIGGNGVWGEHFRGLIDEVRVYNRALTPSEIQADMATPVASGSSNAAPTAVIDTPPASLTWKVGDVIQFSGRGTDPEDGALPASALSWKVILHHCPSNCHTHQLTEFQGVASGSVVAPDHEYPSHLELQLTVRDSGGATGTASVLLQPATVTLAFASSPSGLQLVFNAGTQATPFSRTVIVGSNNSVSAPSPQTLGGTGYQFQTWSDGGAQSHDITAGPSGGSYTATYTATQPPAGPPGLVAAYGFNEGTGSVAGDASGHGHTGTISGATWVTGGKYGGALAFDAVDWVTIAPSSLLDLTTGMTLSAWVKPTGTTGWQTVVLKEQPGGLVYALYSSTTGNVPAAHAYVAGAERRTLGPTVLPANTWTHLAATYDGAMLRLYVNGVQASARAMAGPIATSTGLLRIGGNAVWGEYFRGLIDEVRVYSRALTPSEIQADMAAAIP